MTNSLINVQWRNDNDEILFEDKIRRNDFMEMFDFKPACLLVIIYADIENLKFKVEK